MARLIDANKINGTFADCENYTGREVMALLNQQPTAYDVEKVVAILQEGSDTYKGSVDQYEQGKWFAYSNAVNVVRKGGVE